MSAAAKRFLLHGIPLACLILAGGFARQYASGAGVFEPAVGLMVKARAILSNVKNEAIRLRAVPLDEPVTESATLSADALQRKLAGQATIPAPAAFEPLPMASDPYFFYPAAIGHCRH